MNKEMENKDKSKCFTCIYNSDSACVCHQKECNYEECNYEEDPRAAVQTSLP